MKLSLEQQYMSSVLASAGMVLMTTPPPPPKKKKKSCNIQSPASEELIRFSQLLLYLKCVDQY